jgi:cytochrome c553
MRHPRLALILLLVTTSVVARNSAHGATASRAQLARGRYLVENLADCLSCHSPTSYTGSRIGPLAGQKGAGGPFDFKGLPFPVYVPNITSDPQAGAGSWTDEQLGRAIREGIGHEGRILFPIMPYMSYRAISDEDLAAIVAYLRTLPPVSKPTQTPTIPDQVRKQLPHPPPLPGPISAPNRTDRVKYGGYLAAVAACVECHTPYNEKMEPIMHLAWSGGFVMEGSWGKVASANITPDASGISYYDEKKFIEVIRTGHVGARKLNPIMPFWRFRNLSNSDLRAIYAYLCSLKPIPHRVDNTEPPTYCKVCRGTHGGGSLN